MLDKADTDNIPDSGKCGNASALIFEPVHFLFA